MKIFLWTITLLILGISNSNAKPQPSFDCNKTATEIEKVVCLYNVNRLSNDMFSNDNLKNTLKKIKDHLMDKYGKNQVCDNLKNKIQKDQFKFILPIAVGNSYEEISSIIETKCNIAQLLSTITYDHGTFKHIILSPYVVYDFGDAFILGSYRSWVGNEPNETLFPGHLNSGMYLYKQKNNCDSISSTVLYGITSPIVILEIDGENYMLSYNEWGIESNANTNILIYSKNSDSKTPLCIY